MLRIEHANSWSRVAGGDARDVEWLDDYLSVPTVSFEGGVRQEDRWRMLSAIGHRFGSGVLPLVVEAAGRAGVALGLEDVRSGAPRPYDPRADVSWLRAYQDRAARALAEAGYERGVCKAPTGSGKTELVVAMTRLVPCDNWLMLVHRAGLAEQAAQRYLRRTGEVAGTFVSGEWRPGTCNLTTATFQALQATARKHPAKLRRLVEAVDGVMVDEVHAQASPANLRTTQVFVNARRRYGFSATPMHRGDVSALKVMAATGPVLVDITYGELLRAGAIVRPVVRMVRLAQDELAWSTERDWREVYTRLIVRSRRRNMLLADMADRCAKPCLLFVDELDHVGFMLRHLQMSGLRAGVVHGGHAQAQRNEALRALVGGDLDVVVCTTVFQEGIDVPELRGVVVGCAKSSSVACLQRVGRGMRPSADKSEFEVWDVYDQGQEWLEAHSAQRACALRDEGLDVLVEDW